MYCGKCGREIPEGDVFCSACGARVSGDAARVREGRVAGEKRVWTVWTAVVAIWLAVMFVSIFAPDMVTGTEREHLPIAAMTSWFWGAVATAFVLLSGRARSTEKAHGWMAVVCIWLAVALVSIFAPEMETGTDPTIIPLGAIISPLVGAIATAFVSVFVCASNRES